MLHTVVVISSLPGLEANKSTRSIKWFIGFGKISANLPVKASHLVEIRLHLSSIPKIYAITTCPFFLVRSSSLSFVFLLASTGGLNRVRENVRDEFSSTEEGLALGFPLTVSCFHSSTLESSRLEKYSVILGRQSIRGL